MGILKSSIAFYNGTTMICAKAINSFKTDLESGFSVMLNVILNPDSHDDTLVTKATKTLKKIHKKATKFTIWHDSEDSVDLVEAKAQEFKHVLGYMGEWRTKAGIECTVKKGKNKGRKYYTSLTECFREPKPPKAVEASPETLKKAYVALGLDQR